MYESPIQYYEFQTLNLIFWMINKGLGLTSLCYNNFEAPTLLGAPNSATTELFDMITEFNQTTRQQIGNFLAQIEGDL